MSTIYKDKEFIALRNKAPNAKSAVLMCGDIRCTNNYEKNTTICIDDKTEDNPQNDWLIHLKCKSCNVDWWICKKCNKFKNKLTNNRMINVHRSSNHSEKKRKLTEAKQESNKKIKVVSNDKVIDEKVIDDDQAIQSIQLELDLTIGSSIIDQTINDSHSNSEIYYECDHMVDINDNVDDKEQKLIPYNEYFTNIDKIQSLNKVVSTFFHMFFLQTIFVLSYHF